MSFRRFSLRLLVVLFAVGLAGNVIAEDDHHGHDDHHAGAVQLRLNDGAKWQTDAALRQGMTGVRNEIAAALPQIHEDRLPAGEYVTLATQVNNHLNGIIQNCKLPPEADAQLHIVLSDIYTGLEGMRGGDDRRSGAVKIIMALDVYAKYFDHAGWQPVSH
jgi:hypothetical protein